MGLEAAIPGKAEVLDEASGDAQLGVGRGDEQAPAVRLLGSAKRRGGPSEHGLEEPVGVLDVKAPQVCPEAAFEVRKARP